MGPDQVSDQWISSDSDGRRHLIPGTEEKGAGVVVKECGCLGRGCSDNGLTDLSIAETNAVQLAVAQDGIEDAVGQLERRSDHFLRILMNPRFIHLPT